jgi:hypothetical protein
LRTEKRTPTRPNTGLHAPEKRTRESAQPYKKNQEEEPRGESDSRPHVASLDSKKDSRAKKTKIEPEPEIESAESFERFWRAYPRKVAQEAARKAFAQAIEGGADPEAMIAGAERFAVERWGEPARYTKFPAGWIKDERWKDPPPAGAIIDQHGNIVAVEQPQPQRRELTWADVQAQVLGDEI